MWVATLSLSLGPIRLAVVASHVCEILRKFELIAVQGHWPWCQSKAHVQLPIRLVINSNYGHISYRFRDNDAFSSKIACFFPPHPCLTPPSGGTPCNINVIYIPLKSTFNGLQFRRWHYGSIFIRGAAVLLAPKVAKSRELSPKLDLASVQGHPISSILVSIESAYVTSY